MIVPRWSGTVNIRASCRHLFASGAQFNLFFGVRVFTHNTQLAVQQANSLGNGNGFARYGVVAAYQIGSLAAGDFQPLCIHIFLPCVLTVVRESDFVSREMLLKLKDENEEHTDWLEMQLNLIGEMGLENFIQQSVGEND